MSVMLLGWVTALMENIQPDYPAHFVKELSLKHYPNRFQHLSIILNYKIKIVAVVVDMWSKL